GVKVGVTDLQVHLAADEGEPLSEFEEEFLDMVSQSEFEVTLAADVGGTDEVEQVWVAGGLLSEVGVRGWQGAGEVGDGLAGPLVEAALDVVDQDVAAPALLDGRLGVPFAQVGGVQLVQQGDVVPPWQLCNGALHYFGVRPCCGEGTHVLEVARREAPGV